MCNQKRINVLKRQSVRVVGEIKSASVIENYVKTEVTSAGLTYSDIFERIEKIEKCASIIELSEKFEKGPSGDLEQVLSVAAANYCKQHVICPICADRLQSRRRAVFDQPIKNQSSMVKDGKRFAYMVTYTIADGENLADRLSHLKDSRRQWRLMGQRRKSRRGGFYRSKGEAGKICAGLSSIEIKRGYNSGLWHVHAHELVFTDRPFDYHVYDPDKKRALKDVYGNLIPHDRLSETAKRYVSFNGNQVAASKLSEEWLQATGDSMSIFCEPVYHVPKTRLKYSKGTFKKAPVPKKTKRLLSKMSFEDSVAFQSREIIKYFTKPGAYRPEDTITIMNETYNKRMSATYGEFRGINDLEMIDDAVGEWVVTWSPEKGSYGDPIPGNIRDILQDEAASEARSQSGKCTGQYRRARRLILDQRALYGGSLCTALDELKQRYRAQINGIWALYRHKVSSAILADRSVCDNYSPVLAAQGCYIPGSNTNTVYDLAFA